MSTFTAFAWITSINFGSSGLEAFDVFFFFNESMSYLRNTIHLEKQNKAKPQNLKKYAGTGGYAKKDPF